MDYTPLDHPIITLEMALAGGGTVTFDALDSEPLDHDDTWRMFDLYQRTVGG